MTVRTDHRIGKKSNRSLFHMKRISTTIRIKAFHGKISSGRRGDAEEFSRKQYLRNLLFGRFFESLLLYQMLQGEVR